MVIYANDVYVSLSNVSYTIHSILMAGKMEIFVMAQLQVTVSLFLMTSPIARENQRYFCT